MKRTGKILLICILILAAAVVGGLLTLYLTAMPDSLVQTDPVKAKMDEIGSYLEEYFIDDYDPEILAQKAADGAAAAMVEATGDRWSYYISAEDMEAYNEAFYNEYVGVGIVIQMVDSGVEIISVTQNSPAETAGLQVGDIVTHVEGEATAELGVERTKEIVRGEVGTDVHFTVLRGTETMELDLVRQPIVSPVAEGELLEGGIGLVTISNFDHHCAEQTLSCASDVIRQGAKALIFDVRFNGGGLKDEMLKVLDVLLPEGPLFRSRDYTGEEEIDYSDAACTEMPMAVLVNEDSYSAAEFFAAALQEYGVAVIVGGQTCGKGNFQYTLPLSDGSAVAISVGKYYTPEGRSLTDVGVTPDIPVDLSYEDYLSLYYGSLPREEDEQLQAAVSDLLTKIS